jgi:uncharacterized protein (TIGR03437 family)
MLAASTPLYSNNQPAPATLFFDPCVSADGSLVSYVLNGRLWIQQTNGTGARQLSSPPDTVTAHVLSGSGAVAYAATASSRILQIDVGSGLATELSAPAPHLEIVGGAQVPGALLEVSVSNVTGRDDPALEGIAAPVIARSPQFTTLQIPWEQMPGAVLNLVASVNPSQFEEVDPIELQTALPGFLPSPLGLAPNGFPYALAFHQNFAGMVTPARPAASGEILSIYMTGLGSVSPSISTGAVTPSSSLYLLQTPFSCTWNTRPATVANILFAGLAPGMVGVEQVNIQTPVVSGALTDLLLECESQEPIGSIGSDATIPAGTAPVIHPGPRK